MVKALPNRISPALIVGVKRHLPDREFNGHGIVDRSGTVDVPPYRTKISPGTASRSSCTCPADPPSLHRQGRERAGAYHGHAVDRLLLPRRERRGELHIVVLQHAEAERTEGVICVERSAVGEIYPHSALRRRNTTDG